MVDNGQPELFNAPLLSDVPENKETTIIKIDIKQYGQVMCRNNNKGQLHSKANNHTYHTRAYL